MVWAVFKCCVAQAGWMISVSRMGVQLYILDSSQPKHNGVVQLFVTDFQAHISYSLAGGQQTQNDQHRLYILVITNKHKLVGKMSSRLLHGNHYDVSSLSWTCPVDANFLEHHRLHLFILACNFRNDRSWCREISSFLRVEIGVRH